MTSRPAFPVKKSTAEVQRCLHMSKANREDEDAKPQRRGRGHGRGTARSFRLASDINAAAEKLRDTVRFDLIWKKAYTSTGHYKLRLPEEVR